MNRLNLNASKLAHYWRRKNCRFLQQSTLDHIILKFYLHMLLDLIVKNKMKMKFNRLLFDCFPLGRSVRQTISSPVNWNITSKSGRFFQQPSPHHYLSGTACYLQSAENKKTAAITRATETNRPNVKDTKQCRNPTKLVIPASYTAAAAAATNTPSATHTAPATATNTNFQ